MASTPFIDVLTPAQRVTVAAKARGAKRPSYYDGVLADVLERNKTTGNTDDAETAEVQISEDLEAALILMSAADKAGLLAFIAAALKVASNSGLPGSPGNDDFAMMSEVVAVRKTSYQQINTDVGRDVSNYDSVRANILGFLEQTARNNTARATQENPTSVVVPDLGALFSSLSDSYRTLSAPDLLAVHDRISDSGLLYAYQNAATHRAKELSSWVGVVTLYLI